MKTYNGVFSFAFTVHGLEEELKFLPSAAVLRRLAHERLDDIKDEELFEAVEGPADLTPDEPMDMLLIPHEDGRHPHQRDLVWYVFFSCGSAYRLTSPAKPGSGLILPRVVAENVLGKQFVRNAQDQRGYASEAFLALLCL